jgi:hypothetical protein
VFSQTRLICPENPEKKSLFCGTALHGCQLFKINKKNILTENAYLIACLGMINRNGRTIPLMVSCT